MMFKKEIKKNDYSLTSTKKISPRSRRADVYALLGHAEPVVRASAGRARGGVNPTVAVRDARVALVVVVSSQEGSVNNLS